MRNSAGPGADDSGWEAEAMHCDGSQAGAGEGASLLPVPHGVPVPQRGRAPKMTYARWWTTQGVEVGAVAVDGWYWRCPVCRVWAGPYRDVRAAKRVGMDHRYDEHDRPAAHRTEAHRAARHVCRTMTAAKFDETVARPAAQHGLTPAVVQSAVHRTATAIDGMYANYQDALFYTGKDLGTARDGDYLKAPHPRVQALVNAIAAELGRPGWLEERMAADAARRR